MFRMNMDLSKVTLSVVLSSLFVWGCAGDGSPQEPLGQVEMNLVGQAPSGNIYRLRSALIQVVGAQDSVWFDTESDPDRPLLSASVSAGNYTSFLEPGWHLERLDPEGTAQAVDAQLLSPNPDEFVVAENQNTQVALRFRADDEVIVIADVSFDIFLDVEEAQSPLSACPAQQAGPGRECGWTMAPGFEGASCVPGEAIVVGCGCAGGTCAGDPMIRVCEGTDACAGTSALALVDDACGVCPETFFTCPDSGVYSVLVASFVSSTAFACEPVTSP
jgi:hypothetical protein